MSVRGGHRTHRITVLVEAPGHRSSSTLRNRTARRASGARWPRIMLGPRSWISPSTPGVATCGARARTMRTSILEGPPQLPCLNLREIDVQACAAVRPVGSFADREPPRGGPARRAASRPGGCAWRHDAPPVLRRTPGRRSPAGQAREAAAGPSQASRSASSSPSAARWRRRVSRVRSSCADPA